MVDGGPAMGVELDVRISTPLTDEDNELLSGIAMMAMSVANQQAARFIIENLQEKADEQEQAARQKVEEETLCFARGEGGTVCVGKVGHGGRHRFRPFAEAIGQVN
jgi:hypothetical protein